MNLCSRNRAVLYSIIRIKWIIALFFIVIALNANPSVPTPADENIVTVMDGLINEPLEAVTIYNITRSFSTFTNARGQADITEVDLTDTLFLIIFLMLM